MYICEICGKTFYTEFDDDVDVCVSCRSYAPPRSSKREEPHPDCHLKSAVLKAKMARMISSKECGINKYQDTLDMTASIAHWELGKTIMAGKATKAKMLNWLTENSNVDRDLNLQLLALQSGATSVNK